MSLAFDPTKNVTVVFSPKRSKRPEGPKACPFCPGSESRTPPATLVLPSEKWTVRAFQNAFAVLPGAHEVVVETDRHGAFFEDFSKEQLGLVFEAYQSRYRFLNRKKGYVLLFKNFGKQSGASIPHEHAQLIRFSFVPDFIRNETRNKKVLDGLLRQPALLQNASFKAVVPPFGRFPWETWILAKDPKKRFENFSDNEGLLLLSLLQKVIRKIKKFSSDYTVAYHAAPVGKSLRFHLEVYPRKPVWGGIELGSGVIVNFKKPRDALSDLKKA